MEQAVAERSQIQRA